LTTRYADAVSSTQYQARPEPADLPLTVRLGISWLTNALVLLVVTVLLTGVTSSGAGALLLAAAVFGVLNTVLKPLLRLITLPLAVVTLGIAWTSCRC
jgi:uncharacterized membrane protein YvlD (DUF360 family)